MMDKGWEKFTEDNKEALINKHTNRTVEAYKKLKEAVEYFLQMSQPIYRSVKVTFSTKNHPYNWENEFILNAVGKVMAFDRMPEKTDEDIERGAFLDQWVKDDRKRHKDEKK